MKSTPAPATAPTYPFRPMADRAIAVDQEPGQLAESHGHLPKTVSLGDRGLVALGASPTEALGSPTEALGSPTEALDVLGMAEKWTRIRPTAIGAGGPALHDGGGSHGN